VGGSCSGSTYTITAGTISALPSQPISKIGKYHKSDKNMTWDQAYYYCEALSKIDDSITGMVVKKNSFDPFGVGGFGWLNFTSNPTPTSYTGCYTYYVTLSSGLVVYHTGGRNSTDNLYALCE
jgi:hypothetical protein